MSEAKVQISPDNTSGANQRLFSSDYKIIKLDTEVLKVYDLDLFKNILDYN